MRTFAVVNQKGGCGKTTTAINLAGVFASRGYRTLLVDLDPQGHCATGLAIPEQRVDLHIGDAMIAPDDEPVDPKRLFWRVSRNLDLAPSTVRLAALEAPRGELAKRDDADTRLKHVLSRFSSQYDIGLIDCSPAIGLLAFNALMAADEVLIPVETGFFSLQGATKQVNTLKAVGKRLGVQPVHRLLATMHDPASALSQDLLEELRRRFAKSVIPVVIRFDQALREAASFGQPVIEYARESTGAQDYGQLADWLIEHAVRNVGKSHDEAVSVIDGPGASPNTLSSDQGGKPELPVSRVADLLQRTRKLGRAVAIAESKPNIGTSSEAGQVDRSANIASIEAIRPAIVSPRIDRGSDTATGAGVSSTHRSERNLDPFSRSQVSAARVANHDQSSEREVLSETAPAGVPMRFGVHVTREGAKFVQPVSMGQHVAVAGEFNNWSPEAGELRINPRDGVLERVLEIPGGSWQYRLVVDGKWMPDPFNPAVCANPFGGSNSIVHVPVIKVSNEAVGESSTRAGRVEVRT